MSDIFIKIFNLGVTAGWFVLAILICRPLMKKVPKWISCLLWGIVGLRLCLPFSFESIFSLIPSAEPLPEDIMMTQTPVINSGVSVLNDAVNPIISTSLTPTVGASINPMQIVIAIASWIWIIGIALMIGYGAISYISLRLKVRVSVKGEENLYFCDDVDSPFILGVIRPRIYAPSTMNRETLEHVIAHEKAHLRRCDHLWKPIGFALLSLYWFNPLLWVAYALLCRDIEAACDEKVIKTMDTAAKKSYSEALLACSIHRKRIMACPLAFGEVGVKQRIKSVLSYKKPAFWVIIAALVATLILSVCFLTNPQGTPKDKLTPGSEWISEGEVVIGFAVENGWKLKGYLNHSSQSCEIVLYTRSAGLVRGSRLWVEIYEYDPVDDVIAEGDLLLSGSIKARGNRLIFEISDNNLGLEEKKLTFKKTKDAKLETVTFESDGATRYVRITDSGSSIPSAKISAVQIKREGDDVVFVLKWKNNSFRTQIYGESFEVYRYESDELIPLEFISYWLMRAVGVGARKLSYPSFNITEHYDISAPGRYRLEAGAAWVEFEVAMEDKNETVNAPAVFDPSYSAYDSSRKYDVYVWQMARGSFSFGLLESKERDWLDDELWNLKGVRAAQMRQILLDRNLGPNDVNIVRWQNPISSYIGDFWVLWPYMNDNTPQENFYYAMIYDMLFGTSSRRYYPTATESERFDIDGDGAKEDNMVVLGLVDGKFMFRYIISEDNKTASYYDTFYTDPMSLKFFTAEDKLRLRGVDEKGGVHIYDIALEGGHIKLTEIENTPIADASKKTLDLSKADFSLVDRIVITNGQTGEVEYLSTLYDRNGFNNVMSVIKTVKATDPVSNKGHYGFSYHVELYYDYQTVFSFSLISESDGAYLICEKYETVGGFNYPARYKLTSPSYESLDKLFGKYFK